MKKIQKILSGLLIIGISMTTFYGCGSASNSATTSEKAITIATTGETGSLDPAGVTSYTYWGYQTYALDELMTYDTDGKEVFKAAESYDVNSDKTVWTFHLRKDATWSDGNPVVANDFINTIKRSLDPKCGSGYSDFLFIIKGAEEMYKGTGNIDNLGVKSIDDYTLQFTLKQPCQYFLDLLRLPVFKPSCVKYAKETDGTWDKDPQTSVANGPYYLAEYVPQQYFVLKKNPKYWNADKIKLDKITYKFFNDQQSQVNAYKTGEVDVVTSAPYYVMDQYDGKPDLKITHNVVSEYLYPNINVKPLDDERVRKAINLAINRQDLCDTVGKDKEPQTSFVPKSMISKLSGKSWEEEMNNGEQFKENVEEAQKLLADAGYPNGQGFPKLKYMYPSREQDSDTAQAVQSQLKKNLNIDIELVAQEMQVNISERRAGNYDLCRMQWTSDFSDPYTYLGMHISNASYNDNHVNDLKYDELMKQSNLESDPVKRNELLHEAENYLIGQKFYLIPLYTDKSCNLVNPKIKDIGIIAANGTQDFTYSDIEQ